jgi:D-beta-D-heptose 7-phosphate kinase/D-beta-D-heptose 1-phosphate adenosyltransferase
MKKSNILVIGDLMVDHYLYGSVDRISPEAPVQVVKVKDEKLLMGGAGNVISNLLALGSKVGVCSVIGDDEGGKFLKERLGQKDVIKEGWIIQNGRKTSHKTRVIASNQQIVRIDKEDSEDISTTSEETLFLRVKIVLPFYDAIILSDYGKGVLTNSLTKKLISLANEHNKPILVDPKGSDYSKYKGATLLTPNKKEAMEATSIQIKDDDSLLKAIKKLKDECKLKYSIITLSEDGIALYEDELLKVPTVAKDVFDVTGAGDTVIASIAVSLVEGKSIVEAIEFANKAAAVAVSHIGCYAVKKEDIENFKESKKIVSLEKLLQVLPKDKKIVFTNGCFDILHSGHVKYLKEAKSFGDILVLGLNSDDSVKRLKGESRPVNEFSDRAEVLAGLEAVDFIVGFEDDTPYKLIKAIKPNVLVKGGDYEGKEVIGSDIAKETKLVQFVDEKSTTNIIKKAKLL